VPIYEYNCATCKKDFELLVRDNEKPECPECGSTRLDKLLSVPMAHIAGGSSLPICETPRQVGGCGPRCGGGSCSH
jgi:putative FmdB family regulatory protein